jgi:hypothetical protein
MRSKTTLLPRIPIGVQIVVVVTERTPRYEVAQMVELAKLRGLCGSPNGLVFL